MNTGIHDATNLAWKLAGELKGWYNPSVLQTYEAERRPSAQKLIEIDKSGSAAISGRIPPKYAQLAAQYSPEEVLCMILQETAPVSQPILHIKRTGKLTYDNQLSSPLVSGSSIQTLR